MSTNGLFTCMCISHFKNNHVAATKIVCRHSTLQGTGWLRMFTKLPNGIHQILVDAYQYQEGHRPFVLLDDVHIYNCQHLSKYDVVCWFDRV